MATLQCGCEGTCAGHTESSRPEWQFKPGKSGNPGGKPKWLKAARESLQSLTPLARKTLRQVMKNGADKDKVAAAKTVLEFTVPKPRQTHRVEGKGGDPLAVLTPEQLVAFVKGEKP